MTLATKGKFTETSKVTQTILSMRSNKQLPINKSRFTIALLSAHAYLTLDFRKRSPTIIKNGDRLQTGCNSTSICLKSLQLFPDSQIHNKDSPIQFYYLKHTFPPTLST